MWLYEFEDQMSRWYDCPHEYIRISGLFTAAAALTHRVYVHSPKRMTTNLYVVILGPAGSGKSTLLLEGLVMLEKILPKDDILPVHASAESLERSISNHAKAAGVHGMMVYDEFQSFIQHIRKEYASNVGTMVLERFQEGANLVSARTGDKGKVEKMTVPGYFLISFAGTDVPYRFAQSLKEADSMGGLLSRVLIAEAGEKTKDHGGFAPSYDETMVQWLTDSLRWLRDQYNGTAFEFTEDAKSWGLKLISELRAHVRGTMNDFYLSATARMEAYLKKLSLLYAAMHHRGDNMIHQQDVDEAGMILRASVKSLQMISEEFQLGEGHYARAFVRVKRLILEKKAVSKGDLLRAIAIKPKELDEIVESLAEQDLVSVNVEGTDVVVKWEG